MINYSFIIKNWEKQFLSEMWRYSHHILQDLALLTRRYYLRQWLKIIDWFTWGSSSKSSCISKSHAALHSFFLNFSVDKFIFSLHISLVSCHRKIQTRINNYFLCILPQWLFYGHMIWLPFFRHVFWFHLAMVILHIFSLNVIVVTLIHFSLGETGYFGVFFSRSNCGYLAIYFLLVMLLLRMYICWHIFSTESSSMSLPMQTKFHTTPEKPVEGWPEEESISEEVTCPWLDHQIFWWTPGSKWCI